MSLAEENENGLLGTQVTWEDVQRDCYSLWGPEAKLGSNKTIKDIADGKGFISRIGVVENTWESPELAEKNGWPMKFVVKMVTFLQQTKYTKELEKGTDRKFYDDEEMKKQVEKYRTLHNIECELYEKFKDCNELSKLKVYVSYPFTEQNPSKGYLIMEFVEDLINMGNETYLEEALVDQILDALARHHSMGLNFTNEERKQYTMGIVTDLFGTMLQENFVATILDMLFAALGEEERETYEKYKQSIKVLMKEENTKKMDDMAEILGMEKNTLCHGDPWTCNVICTEKQGVKKLYALIDYQTSHFGCVGHDLARLLANVLTYDERKNNYERYIHKYWTRISEIWTTKRKELPFSEEQLITAYKAYLPLTSYVVGISTAALIEIRCKTSENPEVAKQIMKKKVIDLGKTLEESLVYLESL